MPKPWERQWGAPPGPGSTDDAIQKASTAAILTNGARGDLNPAQQELMESARRDVAARGAPDYMPSPLGEQYRGWGESAMELLSGLGSTIQAGLDLHPAYRGARQIAEAVTGMDPREASRAVIESAQRQDFGYEPVATWEQAKADPLRQGLPWLAETAVQSVPEMATAMLAPGAYMPAKAGAIAERRAAAEGLVEPGLQERAAGAAAAPAIMALERFGARGMLGLADRPGLGRADQALVAGAREGVTEFPQEVIEYGAETPVAQLDPQTALERGLQGVLAGAATGAGVRSVVGQQAGATPPPMGPPAAPARDPMVEALTAQQAESLGERRVLGPTPGAPTPTAAPAPLGGRVSGAQALPQVGTEPGRRRVLTEERPSPTPLLPQMAEDPLVPLPDGSVARSSELEAMYREQPIEGRAALMGMGQQPATPRRPALPAPGQTAPIPLRRDPLPTAQVEEMRPEQIEAAPAPDAPAPGARLSNAKAVLDAVKRGAVADVPTVGAVHVMDGKLGVMQEGRHVPLTAAQEKTYRKAVQADMVRVPGHTPTGQGWGRQAQMRTAGLDPNDPMTRKFLEMMERGAVEEVEVEGAAPERGEGRAQRMMAPEDVLQYATNVPRRTPAQMTELAESMRQEGFRADEPLVMRQIGGRMELSEGHHRAAAAREAGLTEIPVTVLEQAEGDVTPYVAQEWGVQPAAEPVVAEPKKKEPSTPGPLGTRLYSNPLDPDLLKQALGGQSGYWKSRLQEWKEDLSATKDAFGAPRGHLTIPRVIGRTAQVIARSNDSYLRGLAKAYDSPTIVKIANLLHEPVGRADAVGMSYEQAVDTHSFSNLNKLGKILEPFGRDKAALEGLARELQTGRHTSQAAKDIAAMLKKEHEYQVKAGIDMGQVDNYYPHDYDATRVWQNPERFVQQAAKLYKRTHGNKLKPGEEVELAEKWHDNLLLGNYGIDLNTNAMTPNMSGSPIPNHLKRAVFKRSDAEELMSDFLNQDPVDVLNNYFVRSARRAEWERRFGGDKWKKLKEEMVEDGAYGAIDHVTKAVLSATGNMPNNLSRGVSDVMSWLRVMNALTYLPRATLSSLNELVMPAVRTGDVRVLFRGAVKSLKEAVGTTKTFRGAQDKELAEISEDILGLTGKVAADMLMQQRWGGQIDRKLPQRITNKFFYATGLHQLTEGQRLATLDIGDWFIRKLAKDVREGNKRKKSSEILLKELGISNPSTFAAAIETTPRTADALRKQDGFTEQYRTALTRFVDQTIQSPKAAEKPRYASHPLGAFPYQLTSFIFAFGKNVVERNARLAKTGLTEKGLTAADRMQLAGPAMVMPILILTAAGLGELRDEWLFKDTNRKPRDFGDKATMALSRSGILGPADLLLNLITGIKYERDPATFALGPVASGLSTLLQDVVMMFTDKNSSNTVTAERNFSKHVYNTLVQPFLNGLASLSPAKGLGAAAIQSFSHPQTRGLFMDWTAGEKEPTISRRRRARSERRRRERRRRQRR